MAQGPQRIVRGFGLYEALKEHKPAVVIAVDHDGEETKVNVPDIRQKHSRVMLALREVPWVRCDLLDKKGGLIVRHMRTADDREPAGDVEELGTSTREAAALSGLMSIMLRAQETVLIRHQQAMQQVLDAQMRLVDSMVKRLDLQETQLQHAMTLNHALSSDLVNAQLAQLQLAPPMVEEDGEGNARVPTMSDRALATFLPAFMRAAMEPKDGAKKKVTNGANHAPKEAPAASTDKASAG
jgi:hypothetical protein